MLILLFSKSSLRYLNILRPRILSGLELGDPTSVAWAELKILMIFRTRTNPCQEKSPLCLRNGPCFLILIATTASGVAKGRLSLHVIGDVGVAVCTRILPALPLARKITASHLNQSFSLHTICNLIYSCVISLALRGTRADNIPRGFRGPDSESDAIFY